MPFRTMTILRSEKWACVKNVVQQEQVQGHAPGLVQSQNCVQSGECSPMEKDKGTPVDKKLYASLYVLAAKNANYISYCC